MGIDYLMSRNGKTRNGKVIEISGAGVNVAIVDQGLNAEQLEENYATGWAVAGTRSGTAKPPPGSIRRSHGVMIADNIRKVAPAVKFFDLPLLPSKISNIQPFLSLALAAFIKMLDDIDAVRADAMWLGYSAQGPGQSNLETGKLDLCAPAELKRRLENLPGFAKANGCDRDSAMEFSTRKQSSQKCLEFVVGARWRYASRSIDPQLH